MDGGRKPSRQEKQTESERIGRVPEKEWLEVVLVESIKPRTAHLQIEEVFKTLTGSVRVCDPHYGAGILYRLAVLQADTDVKVLVQQPDRKERTYLPAALTELTSEHPNVKFRVAATKDLHDRHVLSADSLMILGHGLKDIGKKQSFVVDLARDLVPDTAK